MGISGKSRKSRLTRLFQAEGCHSTPRQSRRSTVDQSMDKGGPVSCIPWSRNIRSISARGGNSVMGADLVEKGLHLAGRLEGDYELATVLPDARHDADGGGEKKNTN